MKAINTIKSKISNNLSIGIKQIQSILTASLFATSMVLVPWGTVTAQVKGDAVKWHPGHYMTIMSYGKDKDFYMNDVYQELASTPAMRGIQVRFLWAELEKSKGVYNFALIDKLLKEVTTRGKRLIIQVQTKSFDPDWKLVPDYLKTAEYSGGVFPFYTYGTKNIRGYNIKLWDIEIRNRLVALFNALGKRYNDHPNFEGIGMIESAIGPSPVPLSTAQINAFFDNLLYVHKQMKLQFPNTMTIQELNYPRDQLPDFINGMKTIGTAIGCPDIFIQEPGLLFPGNKYSPKGAYKYYAQLSGVIPITPTVELPNYEDTRWDGSGYKPTISELFNFAKTQLKANYVFWTRSPGHYEKVLELLNFNSQKTTPSGGLNAACPNSYPSCLTK